MGRLPGSRIAGLLRLLVELRGAFDPVAGARKMSTVRELCNAIILRPSQLAAYHDALCFLRAYPDNPQLAALVERELRSFASRVEAYTQLSRDKRAERLANTGIVNTTTTHPFSYDMTQQLLRWYPGMLELDWDENDEDVANRLCALFPLVVAWQENDTPDNDDAFDVVDWLKVARGKSSLGDLQTVVRLLAASGLPVEVQRHLFDDLDIVISWKLIDSPASRTLKRTPSGRRHYQRESLRARTPDLRAELAKSPSPLRLLSRQEGRDYVRSVNEVLAVRNRELYPLTLANPGEVYLNEPGRGLRIVIFGTRPDVRLPLESNFGALLVRNGVPIGYGISATLFGRVEVAINIFPAFRSGESSFIIEQFFRVFYHHFGSRVFVVRSTQMGHGEDEALHSGAFWFYYKLGFRAVKERIRKSAQKEYEKIQRRSTYRTPIRLMKRLAKSDVFFHTDIKKMNTWQELSIVNLGYLVTRYFAVKFDGDRQRGIHQSASKIAGILGIRNLMQWPKGSLVAFERMAPLIANIPDLVRWTPNEKAALVRVIRSKGAVRERDFVLLSNRHHKLKEVLELLATSPKHIQ